MPIDFSNIPSLANALPLLFVFSVESGYNHNKGERMQLDLTKPNNGRMLDYWLGGSHNFEIDRQLADQVTSKFPLIKQLAPDTRILVQRGVEYFYARGIRTVLDFGSALPTCDNTHLVAEKIDPTIKVVYSDIDPLTVAYAQEILEDNLHVIYLQCDAAQPNVLLDSPAVREFIGDERRVGIIFLNLAHTMTDQSIRDSWQALHAWVAPGSYLFISNASELWRTEPELIAVGQLYAGSNIQPYYRTAEEIAALAPPWRVTSEGIVNQRRWYGPDAELQQPRCLSYAAMLSK